MTTKQPKKSDAQRREELCGLGIIILISGLLAPLAIFLGIVIILMIILPGGKKE